MAGCCARPGAGARAATRSNAKRVRMTGSTGGGDGVQANNYATSNRRNDDDPRSFHPRARRRRAGARRVSHLSRVSQAERPGRPSPRGPVCPVRHRAGPGDGDRPRVRASPCRRVPERAPGRGRQCGGLRPHPPRRRRRDPGFTRPPHHHRVPERMADHGHPGRRRQTRPRNGQPPRQMTRCAELHTTLGPRAEAEALAGAMVEARLAACAQVTGPLASVYRWQGGIERAEEWACILKTPRAALAPLETALRARHPYELPEIVTAPLDGSAAYLVWIEQSVASGAGLGLSRFLDVETRDMNDTPSGPGASDLF